MNEAHSLPHNRMGSQQGALCFPDTQLKAMAGNYSVSVHSPGPGQELLQASFTRQSRIPGWLSCPYPGSPFALFSGPPLEQVLPWGLGSHSYFLSPLGLVSSTL